MIDGLSILSEINRQRGYIVFASWRRYKLGHILAGLTCLDSTEGPRDIDQPLRIMAVTDRADFDAQLALSVAIEPGWSLPDPAWIGPFFYRLMTD